MSTKKGKRPNKRTVAKSSDDVPAHGNQVDESTGRLPQANQWQATEQQLAWLKYYMDPREEETYANPYQAAIKAGYSESYAARIMSPSVALQWVQQAKNIMRTMNPEHIRSTLEEILLNKMEKASDRIAAAKLLGTDQGMFVQKTINAHVGLEEALRELE